MIFKIGSKVQHKVYGVGVVTDLCFGAKGSENYAVRFEKGGPVGWAENSTNDVKDLTQEGVCQS